MNKCPECNCAIYELDLSHQGVVSWFFQNRLAHRIKIGSEELTTEEFENNYLPYRHYQCTNCDILITNNESRERSN